jgi:hypothetical protein
MKLLLQTTLLTMLQVTASFAPVANFKVLPSCDIANSALYSTATNPPHWGTNNPHSSSGQPPPQQQQYGSVTNNNVFDQAKKFHPLAPDANLASTPAEYKAQFKAKFKADLERRRREDPNRGNQPAKSYLDSL